MTVGIKRKELVGCGGEDYEKIKGSTREKRELRNFPGASLVA